MSYNVYILKSVAAPERYYVGVTNDLQRRLAEHNNPNEPSWTKRYAPWRIHCYSVFEDPSLARNWEAYLKIHSGKAFLAKHFL